MNFKDAIKNDLAVFFNQNELADEVLYNDISMTAIFEFIQTNKQGNGYDDKGSANFAYFWLNMDKSPKNGDKIVYNGTTYRVNKTVEHHGSIYKVEVTYDESPLNSKPTRRYTS